MVVVGAGRQEGALPANQPPHGPHPARYTALPKARSTYSYKAKHMDHKPAQMYMIVHFTIPVLIHVTGSP